MAYALVGSYDDCLWSTNTTFGSGVAKALVSYIDASCGGDVSVELDYDALCHRLEFTETQIRKAVARLIANGHARITREYHWTDKDVLQLLTPGRLADDAREAEAARRKEATRAAKIALRGGQVNRAPISDGVRDFVFDRDGHACRLCGATEDLTLDHIHPWSLGGPDTPDNLRVLCRPCNSSKGDRVQPANATSF
jgi:hypothetical protein